MEKDKLIKLKEIVDGVFGVDITETNRQRRYVNARMVFSKIARQHFYVFHDIGRFLGRDHATIIHYMRVFDSYCLTDKNLRDNYISCLNCFSDESFDVSHIKTTDQLKKEIISLKRQNNLLSSELVLCKAEKLQDERVSEIISIIKERTRLGAEDLILRKLKIFYNGVYNN